MFEKVKNYKVCVLCKRHLKKHACFSELKSHCKSIFEDIERAVENGGYVIALKRKNSYKSVYIFEPELPLSNNETGNLEFTRSCTLPEVDRKIINGFERAIIKRIRKKVFFGSYEQVTWLNTRFTPPPQKSGIAVAGLMYVLFQSAGIIMGGIFGNIAIGFLLGGIAGIICGMAVKLRL